MCVTATAKRRRRQAVNGYKHLPPRQRPHYVQHSGETYEKREAQAREKRLSLQLRKR